MASSRSPKTLAFAGVPTSDDVRQAIFATLEANGMRDDTHIRLTLTRGEKITSGMNPKLNQSGCSLIVLAEWKKPVYDAAGNSVLFPPAGDGTNALHATAAGASPHYRMQFVDE